MTFARACHVRGIWLVVLLRYVSTKLYQVNIALERLIVIVVGVLEASNRASNHTGELGIHCNIGVVIYNVHDLLQLFVEVVGPNIYKHSTFIVFVWIHTEDVGLRFLNHAAIHAFLAIPADQFVFLLLIFNVRSSIHQDHHLQCKVI